MIDVRSNARSHSRRLTDRARAALTDDDDDDDEGLPSFGSRLFSPGVVREIENADDDDAHRKTRARTPTHAKEKRIGSIRGGSFRCNSTIFV